MKTKTLLLTSMLLGIYIAGLGADGEYAVSKIPDSLRKNADAVVRVKYEQVELQRLDRMVVKTHYVITLLNENGSRLANMVEGYDRFTEINSIEGNLYDELGHKIKSLKNKDLQDYSAVSDMELAGDSRYKAYSFYHKIFPYTVEYIIETVKKESMFFPVWIPVPGEKISIEKSSMQILVPADYLLRYKSYNYDKAPERKIEKGKQFFTWQLLNYPAIEEESASPGWMEITPTVLLAPSEFEIEDFRGNMNDWSEFGKFQLALNKGRDILPDKIKQKVAELTSNVKSVNEKVKILYNFLQSNTRYISIQLGIGGWRPFEASYVAAKSYGDCKALSNYMNALLKEAGISSYYTLIKAGRNEDDIITDFTFRQFNHAVVCVPNDKDTIWLECTSQNTSAGYMGSFTGNRHALIITENGGKVVSTPRYGLKENLQVRHVKAKLEDDGTLQIATNSRYEAEQQDEIQSVINGLSKDKVKEYLHDHFDFATYDVTGFKYNENKSNLPSVDEQLDISVSNYATITGKRLFIIPNVMTRSRRRWSEDKERKFDIVMNYSFRDIDSVEIELPAGYETEAKPQDVNLTTPYGKYSSSVKLSGNKLYYYRTIEQYSGRYPAKDYKELVKYFETIYKADRNKVVLVKKG